MQYKVVPFIARISNAGGASDAAAQLDALIATEVANGWEYVQLEQVHTAVAGIPGNNGCFGFGAVAPTPGYQTTYSVAVFKK
jgi:hypothetical protein